jgi:hypothetical protein
VIGVVHAVAPATTGILGISGVGVGAGILASGVVLKGWMYAVALDPVRKLGVSSLGLGVGIYAPGLVCDATGIGGAPGLLDDVAEGGIYAPELVRAATGIGGAPGL